jgi:hypothetical protein
MAAPAYGTARRLSAFRPGVGGANRVLQGPGGQSKLQSRCFVLLSPVPGLTGSPVRVSTARRSCDRRGNAFLKPQTAISLHRGPPDRAPGSGRGCRLAKTRRPLFESVPAPVRTTAWGRGWTSLTGRQCFEVGSASGVSRDAQVPGTGCDAVFYRKLAPLAVGSLRTRGCARADR